MKKKRLEQEMKMIRDAFKMKLKPGFEAEYHSDRGLVGGSLADG